ncbi:MAG: endonuclease/exonuclease/phosphatase family protein [Pyrinomonadaceae bacterium]|nr:endonuclease/exonuclease/phosphatase family protein [Pyrinomonadaceae bacterium]
MPEALRVKLERLLTTPFVSNAASARGVKPLKPDTEGIGRFLRVVFWNIEQGLEYESIERAFADPEKFSHLLDDSKLPRGSHRRELVLEQAALLKEADVVVLNEVDWGMQRSDYHHVARDLAAALGMNYAYGVEFVEVDPGTVGNQTKPVNHAQNVSAGKVDPARYKGLHGSAILSRFPLENVRMIPFQHQSYDWYADERREMPGLERVKRKIGQMVFKKNTIRQVRRGGRMMLLADITDPEIPSGRMTIVTTHLEARAEPRDRVKQLEEVLIQIKDINNPVALAGDLNTSGRDAIPTSLRREIKKQFSSVPLFASNPESKFFSTLKNFRFSDGGAFDFRGESARSINGNIGTLADSNQRERRGFVSTSGVERSFGFIGQFKLDWIFIKPPVSNEASVAEHSYRFSPHFGRTLKALNYSIEGRISDHNPVTVDLPFTEPRLH